MRDLEKERQDQIRIEQQYNCRKRKSSTCRDDKHRICFVIHCTCKCHMEE